LSDQGIACLPKFLGPVQAFLIATRADVGAASIAVGLSFENLGTADWTVEEFASWRVAVLAARNARADEVRTATTYRHWGSLPPMGMATVFRIQTGESGISPSADQPGCRSTNCEPGPCARWQ